MELPIKPFFTYLNTSKLMKAKAFTKTTLNQSNFNLTFAFN